MTTSIPEETAKSAPAAAPKKARGAKRRAHAAPAQAKPARKATPANKAATARRGSKTPKILDLLKPIAGAIFDKTTTLGEASSGECARARSKLRS
jgi:hypothetical protein